MELENGKRSVWQPALTIFGEVSAWVVAPIILALILGRYLDGLLGTKPWLFLGMTAIAFLISLFGIIKTVSKYIRQIDKENHERNNQQPK